MFTGSSLVLASKANQNLLTETPARGGTLVEGVVGLPRFINPLLAVTQTGEDLSRLVYSGLLKKDPGGEYVPDLAESFTVSEDGKIYTVTLRDNIYFHDGNALTADDVLFTIERARDPLLKSPVRANWDGVTITKINDRLIEFALRESYSWFTESLTIGILPSHIWSEVSIDEFSYSSFNIEPIGSGPYKVKKIKSSSGGIPASYELTSFKEYVGGEPYISRIIMRFYTNEEKLIEAYNRGDIESIGGISPERAYELVSKEIPVKKSALPRIFGVFFNQNQNALFTDGALKHALDVATPRTQIIDSILQGFGTPITSPVDVLIKRERQEEATNRITNAISILEEDGWELNDDGIRIKKVGDAERTLSFSISTSDAPDLKAIANILSDEWRKIGADVEVKIFETGDLNQNIIRPRNFDALLFGQIVSRQADLYAFWHSSQKNDPGLNIAQYTSTTADKALEDLRVTLDKERQKILFETFVEELESDAPAIFIFSPEFLYTMPRKVKGASSFATSKPSDRFAGIESWYIETDKVWKVFLNN